MYVHLSTHKSGNKYCTFLFKIDPNGKILSAIPFSSHGFLAADGWQIHMLDYILKVADRDTSEGQKEVRVARILLYKVFYDQTENGILPFIFRLIKNFDVQKQPRRHALYPSLTLLLYIQLNCSMRTLGLEIWFCDVVVNRILWSSGLHS